MQLTARNRGEEKKIRRLLGRNRKILQQLNVQKYAYVTRVM